MSDDQQAVLSRLGQMIEASDRVVVFTGAGISTESGIPDFRSPGGLWSKYKPIDFQELRQLLAAYAPEESSSNNS